MTRQSRNGQVLSLASDDKHRFSKRTRDSLILQEGYGIEGDAHAGEFVKHRWLARRQPHQRNLRQVHLLSAELLADLRHDEFYVHPGELGDNITTMELDLEQLPLGTFLKIGETAVVEITGVRTPCALINRFSKGLKRRLVLGSEALPRFRCGVLGIVQVSGRVIAGDRILVQLPDRPWIALPAL